MRAFPTSVRSFVDFAGQRGTNEPAPTRMVRPFGPFGFTRLLMGRVYPTLLGFVLQFLLRPRPAAAFVDPQLASSVVTEEVG